MHRDGSHSITSIVFNTTSIHSRLLCGLGEGNIGVNNTWKIRNECFVLRTPLTEGETVAAQLLRHSHLWKRELGYTWLFGGLNTCCCIRFCVYWESLECWRRAQSSLKLFGLKSRLILTLASQPVWCSKLQTYELKKLQLLGVYV